MFLLPMFVFRIIKSGEFAASGRNKNVTKIMSTSIVSGKIGLMQVSAHLDMHQTETLHEFEVLVYKYVPRVTL